MGGNEAPGAFARESGDWEVLGNGWEWGNKGVQGRGGLRGREALVDSVHVNPLEASPRFLVKVEAVAPNV